MEDALRSLLEAISGLRGDMQNVARDMRAVAVEHRNTTRELVALARDLHDELEQERIARQRGERLEARLSAIESRAAAGG